MALCECGCGRTTPLAQRTDRRRNVVKGQPRRFVLGHGNRRPLTYQVVDRGHTTPCWEWHWSLSDKGYGHTYRAGQAVPAHRAFYEDRHGPIADGLFLDHLCRNPCCVNPEHLEPVTNAENCRRGVKAKLTYDDVAEIRRLAASGHRQRDIGSRFGVTQAQVSNIVRGKQWVTV